MEMLCGLSAVPGSIADAATPETLLERWVDVNSFRAFHRKPQITNYGSRISAPLPPFFEIPINSRDDQNSGMDVVA